MSSQDDDDDDDDDDNDDDDYEKCCVCNLFTPSAAEHFHDFHKMGQM